MRRNSNKNTVNYHISVLKKPITRSNISTNTQYNNFRDSNSFFGKSNSSDSLKFVPSSHSNNNNFTFDIDIITNSNYFKNKYIIKNIVNGGNKLICKLEKISDINSTTKTYYVAKIFNNTLDHSNKYSWGVIYTYFDGCTLSRYIKQQKLDISSLSIIFKKIVLGVKYLHDNDIIHCDLKLQNIMIDDDLNIKIIDFDFSKITKDLYISDSVFGTDEYIAPESHDLCIYSKKSDIWNLGILLYYLIVEKFPYGDDHVTIYNSYEHLYRRNKFKHLDMDKLLNTIEQKNLSYSLYDLISKLLVFKDTDRFTIDDILNFEL
jgi:serine/threonine-protein kinase CHEK2